MLKSVILIPLIISGHLSPSEADAVAERLEEGMVIPSIPSEFAALINQTIAEVRGLKRGD